MRGNFSFLEFVNMDNMEEKKVELVQSNPRTIEWNVPENV